MGFDERATAVFFLSFAFSEKKMRSFLALSFAILAAACSTSTATIETDVLGSDEQSVTCGSNNACPTQLTRLVTASAIAAGSVSVRNDDKNLYIEVVADSPWQLHELNLFAGTGALPVNPAGQPVPGHFPYRLKFATPTTRFSQAIPLANLPGGCGQTLKTLVHADVTHQASNGIRERAYGDGTRVPALRRRLPFPQVQPALFNTYRVCCAAPVAARCTAGSPVICTQADGGEAIGTCSSTCQIPGTADCAGNPDSDGDGAANAVDMFPNDAAETGDLDRDGIGDNADADDDNDQIPDSQDANPKTAEVSILDTIPPVMLVGELQRFTLTVGGPRSSEAQLSLKSGPAGASYVGSAHEVLFTPTAADLGERRFVVRATAGNSVVEKTLRTVVAQPLTGAQATIGPAGGSVELTDSTSPAFGARLTFPPGAVATNTVISLRPLNTAGAGIELVADGSSLGTALLLEPRGIQFAVPVELTLPADVSASETGLVLAAIEPGDSTGLRGTPPLTLVDGRWRAKLSGFSVVRVMKKAANTIGGLIFNGGRPIDLLAQKAAVQCATRVQCALAAKQTTTCGAFATFNRCLWEGYEKASAKTGDSFSPTQFLGSLYDLSTSSDDPYFWPGLGLEPKDGSRSARPGWLDGHDDANPALTPNHGFRTPYPHDGDTSGRKDHFVTSARATGLAGAALTAAEPALGGSMNDVAVNFAGAKFGVQLSLGMLKDGPSIERYVQSTLCANPTLPAPATEECKCGQLQDSSGCCVPDPSVDPDTCDCSGGIYAMNADGSYVYATDPVTGAFRSVAGSNLVGVAFVWEDASKNLRGASGYGLVTQCEWEANGEKLVAEARAALAQMTGTLFNCVGTYKIGKGAIIPLFNSLAAWQKVGLACQ